MRRRYVKPTILITPSRDTAAANHTSLLTYRRRRPRRRTPLHPRNKRLPRPTFPTRIYLVHRRSRPLHRPTLLRKMRSPLSFDRKRARRLAILPPLHHETQHLLQRVRARRPRSLLKLVGSAGIPVVAVTQFLEFVVTCGAEGGAGFV